ncbi:MAG TPA: hypothetical protein PKY77_25740 [Phycisphaerae bacterium]|nr:hypothetical protein [Phycisphaerae bacterium]HRY71433.1 hypothetical protein [Phycisphaerae bacterium]HSA29967.1 hypothetical protein [Phycisphaerae bacterium]
MNASRTWMLACALVGLLAGAASAATIFVATTGDDANDGLSWTAAKRTVQAGLDAASDGDEIIVGPGTYPEAINFLGKAVYLRSSGGAAKPADPQCAD